MLPPHSHLAGLQINLRLVEHHELLPFDSVAQLPLQVHPIIGRGIQIIGIELKVIPALFLGVIFSKASIDSPSTGKIAIPPRIVTKISRASIKKGFAIASTIRRATVPASCTSRKFVRSTESL